MSRVARVLEARLRAVQMPYFVIALTGEHEKTLERLATPPARRSG